MQARNYSDEELSAWVDGEGSAAERAEIHAWLSVHSEQAARVAAWVADRDALRAAYANVAQEAVPPRLAETVWSEGVAAAAPSRGGATSGWGFGPAAGRAPAWKLAAAVAAVFVLGAAVGAWGAWQWKERQQLAGRRGTTGDAAHAPQAHEGWLRRAAFAHSVYTIEPRHAVEVKAQEEHLARWLTRRIEAPVKLFDLRALGFELVGGRLLPDGAGKSAQLMYQDTQGKRITVYLRKPERGTDTAFRYEQHGALGMFYWVEEACGFALVGELPKERLLMLAKAIYEQDAILPPPSLTPPASSAAATSGTSGASGTSGGASAPARRP
jgi:anti-sigma factor RsiW